MTKHNYIIRVLSLSILLCTACNASPTPPSVSDFDKLCNIYKQISVEYKKSTNRISSESQLYKQIQAELPNMLEDYDNIITAARNERYQLYQEVAKIRLNKKWDCTAAKLYYFDS